MFQEKILIEFDWMEMFVCTIHSSEATVTLKISLSFSCFKNDQSINHNLL